RAVVRDRRAAQQPVADRPRGGAGARRPADHRQPVQEQGGAERTHRARRDHHVAPRAAAERGRGAAAAAAAGPVPAAGRERVAMARISTDSRIGGDRGAILVPVACALLLFTVLSAFVIDYAVQLVGRAQVQNAADAAALAGATALA